MDLTERYMITVNYKGYGTGDQNVLSGSFLRLKLTSVLDMVPGGIALVVTLA